MKQMLLLHNWTSNDPKASMKEKFTLAQDRSVLLLTSYVLFLPSTKISTLNRHINSMWMDIRERRTGRKKKELERNERTFLREKKIQIKNFQFHSRFCSRPSRKSDFNEANRFLWLINFIISEWMSFAS